MMAPMGDTAPDRATSAATGDSTAQASQAASAAAFIARWRGVTASELSTSQSFVIQLCELLGVQPPHPTPEQSYMFERPITFPTATAAPAPGASTATGVATSSGRARS
jgi:hypothetical protein